MMRYTESHEWIEEGVNPKKIGITTHAQHELGEIVYVELPKVGSIVKKGQEIAVLESTKAAADVYAPCPGTILEVNEALKKDPSLINNSPEKEGWLCKIESDDKELESLLDQTSYQKLFS
jgi:glycine cleavage system H protein